MHINPKSLGDGIYHSLIYFIYSMHYWLGEYVIIFLIKLHTFAMAGTANCLHYMHSVLHVQKPFSSPERNESNEKYICHLPSQLDLTI